MVYELPEDDGDDDFDGQDESADRDDDDDETESEDEVFDEEDRMPAGNHVERLRAPFHVRQFYTILELVHDSGVGRKVHLCERPTSAKHSIFSEWVKLNGGIATRQQQHSPCIL